MKQYSVDRIVGGIAVLTDDNGAVKEVPCKDLPAEVKEGDILSFDGECYRLEAEKTADKKEEVKRLIDALFQ